MSCLTPHARDVVLLTNQERHRNGLPTLTASAILTTAACEHARDMAAHDYFSHTGRDGRQPDERIDDAGYPPSWTGENIAAGNPGAGNTFDQWTSSPPHLANLLSEHYTETGICRAEGGTYGHYWVQTFGGATTAIARACGYTPAPPKPKPDVPKDPPPRNVHRRRRMRRLLRRLRNR